MEIALFENLMRFNWLIIKDDVVRRFYSRHPIFEAVRVSVGL
jgi:hypothetical protein